MVIIKRISESNRLFTHTRSGKYMTMPCMFENEMEEDDYYVDLVIYPISPSISMPTSYPMLDANSESIDLSTIGW